MRLCVDCGSPLSQSAQKAKTGPNSRIKRCRACYLKSADFRQSAKKGHFKPGILSTPKPFLAGVPSWNAGTAQKDRPNREQEREYAKGIAWRTAVFERDNYTCQDCGVRGGKLNADHIKPWAEYPKLRYEVSNGQTLCVRCHKLKTAIDLRRYWRNQYRRRQPVMVML